MIRGINLKNLSLAEKVLCLITYQLETRNNHISEETLKDILGNPPKSTYYRIIRMLLDGGLNYRPLLKSAEGDFGGRRFNFFFEIKR
jgi:hypothetical protein